MQKGAAAVDGSTRALGEGYFAAAEAVRDFNMKLIEIAQANTMATLNFAQEVATARGLPKLQPLVLARSKKLRVVDRPIKATDGTCTKDRDFNRRRAAEQLYPNAAREHLSQTQYLVAALNSVRSRFPGRFFVGPARCTSKATPALAPRANSSRLARAPLLETVRATPVPAVF